MFVSSEIGNWQWPEIGFALDRQAADLTFPVIPILLDGADTTRRFLFLNTWVDMRGDRFDDDAVLDKVIEALERPDHSSEPPAADFSPYRGLEFFDEPHAPFFFGRESFAQDLFHRLVESRKTFVAVIGASGSGKSSVVRAGLFPLLRRQRPPKDTWDIAVCTPGESPWFRLADCLAELRFPDKADAGLDVEVDKLHRALQVGELSLRSLLDRILNRQGQFHRLLLVVDQFEELFTLTPPDQRQPVINGLLDALSLSRVVLVPTLRADFYGHAIDANRRLSDLLGAEQVTLGRLNTDELRRTIVEPARRAHLSFDSGLVELLLRDAGDEPGNLPLLQHALHELYSRRHGSQLSVAAYHEIGGIHRAIAVSAESEYQKLTGTERDLARSVFTQLVRIARANEGVEDTRRRAAMTSLPEEARFIIDRFASPRLRLLVKSRTRTVSERSDYAGPMADIETVEIAHEALIREWSRLKEWLDLNREFYLWRQRLDQAFADYLQHGRSQEYLLQGGALQAAEHRIAGHAPEPIGSALLQYIQDGVEKRVREALAREALECEARDARAAQQDEAVRHAETQRIHAERDRQLAEAQAFADRRRSHLAIVAAVISLAFGLWAILR